MGFRIFLGDLVDGQVPVGEEDIYNASVSVGESAGTRPTPRIRIAGLGCIFPRVSIVCCGVVDAEMRSTTAISPCFVDAMFSRYLFALCLEGIWTS